MTQIPRIICLTGPTASGKTALALELVKRLPCDIISVDSAMVYRGMDIGTAKPDDETLKLAPHRLIDICDPTQAYSAAQFCHDASIEIESIIAQKRIPLLVGGTLLYFRALQQGLSELPSANQDIRESLIADANKYGWPSLHQRLEKIDPIAAKRIDVNDIQRIQRALEVYLITGKSLSAHWQEPTKHPSPYQFLNFALIPTDRDLLYQNIEKRFYDMLDRGFIDEVKQLHNRTDLNPQLPSMRTVGYRQIWHYLDGEYDYPTMCERSIIATRQFAKRQLTWLRSMSNIHELICQPTINLEKLIEKIYGS